MLGKTPEARARSLANLKSMSKGEQPPNQRGRPRTKAIGEDVRKWLARRDAGMKCLRKETLFKRLMDVRPDVLAAYAWGKPLDRVELTGANGGPIALDTGLLAAAQALARSIALGEPTQLVDVTPVTTQSPAQLADSSQVAGMQAQVEDCNRTGIVQPLLPGGDGPASIEATGEGGDVADAKAYSPQLMAAKKEITSPLGGRAKTAAMWPSVTVGASEQSEGDNIAGEVGGS